MHNATPPPAPNPDYGDNLSFAALMHRVGRTLHSMHAALQRRGLWLVFGALGGLIGGTIVAATAEPTVNPNRYYKATTTMQLVEAATGEAANPVPWSLQIATTATNQDSYLEHIAKQTGTSAEYVHNHLVAVPDPDTATIALTVVDVNPEKAEQTSYHAGLALNEAIVARLLQRQRSEQEAVDETIQRTRRQVDELRQQIDQGPDTARAALQSDLQVAENRLDLLQGQKKAATDSAPQFEMFSKPSAIGITSKAFYLRWLLGRNAVSITRIRADFTQMATGQSTSKATSSSARILNRETDLQPPTKPHPVRPISLGLLAGLVLGLSGVMLGEAWDERVHESEQAALATGFDVLTEVPRLSRRAVQALLQDGQDADPSSARQAAVRYQEAVRIIARQLGLDITGTSSGAVATRSTSTSTRTPLVLITSATPSEGKSTSAASLAAGFAQLGFRVLAVDGDYHRRSLRRHLRAIPDFVDPHRPKETSMPGIWLLDETANLRKNHSGSTTVSGLVRRIDSVRDDYDVVLLDTPPMLNTTDATDFLYHADAVVLVVRIDQTLVPSCERAGTMVRHRHVPVCGTIVTDVPPKMIGRSYGSRG